MCSETQDVRICRTCEVEKPLNKKHYYARDDGKRKNGYQLDCKECFKEKMLINRIGVDYKQYHSILKSQSMRCGICFSHLQSSRYTKFAVDHCHTTGKVRGLLCSQCNTALGLMKDSPHRLKSAIRYLHKHSHEDIV